MRELLSSSKPTSVLLRLTGTSVFLLLIVIFFARPIAISLLPLYRAVFELIASDYRILFLGLSFEGADSVIRMDVTLSHAIAVEGHLVMANPEGVATVTTMIGNIFQPVMAGLVAILTWPFCSWRDVTLRLTILILLCLLETTLDIPLFMAGELWGVFLDNLAPGNWSVLTGWADFLQGGGRFALGLTASIFSIAAANYACRSATNWKSKPGPS
jgi:hypothetical protein